MIDYSNIGKGGIVKEGIFNRFEILKPALLDNYWSDKHSKLMIVAESNYLGDDVDCVFKDPNLWYQGDDSRIKQLLKDQEKKVSTWKYYRTFSKLCKVMNEVANTQCKSVYEEAVFYDYFLRPATVRGTNRSFEKDCKQLDRDVAGTALCGAIDILNPDIVIFASKYAYDEFKDYLTYSDNTNIRFVSEYKYLELAKYNREIRIDYVNHPAARGYYNNWYKSENGKQKFERLLKEYWIK
jgi:hypothetical protein